jgi:hypothetical protein
MNIVMSEKPVVSARAWRVIFRAPSSEPDFDSLIACAPRQLVAEREEIDISEALAAEQLNKDATEFTVIWAPPGASNVEPRAESWIGARSPFLRASISTIRVLWSNNRAVYFCAPELYQSGYDAIIRFTAIAREASSLERRMAGSWRGVSEHIGLVHSTSRIKQGDINAATENIIKLEMALLTTQASLEQLDEKLDSTSKRLCAELIIAANLHDRLEMLEDPIEFVSNHYEVVNSRLIEGKNASRGIWLEILIVLLLAVNTAMLFVSPHKDPAPIFKKAIGASTAPIAGAADKE